MKHIEQWIWLPRTRYVDAQTSIFTGFDCREDSNHVVAEFMKDFSFNTKVVRADIRFSADTAVQLYCNGKIVATGPAAVGGDFFGNDRPRENYYALETTVYPDSEELNFFARVRLLPVQIFEFSTGHGGFMLSAVLTFADGTQTLVATDETWLARKNGGYTAPKRYDGRIAAEEFGPAEITENLWHTQTAPIPVRVERELFPQGWEITLAPMEEKTVTLELDMVWGGFVHVKAESAGTVYARVVCREQQENGSQEEVILCGEDEYRGFYTHSAGNLLVSVKNDSMKPARLGVSFIATHYPVAGEVETVTDDPDMNLVLQLCKHTLKICRQTHHLDSTRHCEPLACTGDYYIESLMTMFSYGDMRLASFDLLRTAVMLEREKGRMFHTTYSLIWVRMLRDVFMATGDMELLRRCEKALGLLLKRFEGYLGENGLLETPPDYMFVDWIYIDEISMHHPPKALGQTCLNMFYFGALETAAETYRLLGSEPEALHCDEKRRSLRTAINELLFDKEKGCYFEGLNTPTPPELIGEWMPENVQKRYYLKHSNILAACFGVCDDETGKKLVDMVMAEQIPGDYQPYFMHYLLEAVYRLGLREKYTRVICDRWKAPALEFPKGLVEGFVTPEPGYGFDHSHAWGGTPLYSLPKALLGFEITKPGMREIRLSPKLLGLGYAKVSLMTPFGHVTCEMRENHRAIITHPEEVTVLLN